MPRWEKEPVAGGHNSFTQAQSLSFWERRWRNDYLAPMMPAVYEATLERARRLAAEHPNSFLAKHLKQLYGVS